MAVAPKLENARARARFSLRREENLIRARPVRFTDGIDLLEVRSLYIHVCSYTLFSDQTWKLSRSSTGTVASAMRKYRAIHPLTPSRHPARTCVSPCGISRLTLGISVQRAQQDDTCTQQSVTITRELIHWNSRDQRAGNRREGKI